MHYRGGVQSAFADNGCESANCLGVHASEKDVPMTSPGVFDASITYLSNQEAAAFLKLSPRTLEKQRMKGTGPKFRKFGRRVVYAVEDLQAWSNERVFDSTARRGASVDRGA